MSIDNRKDDRIPIRLEVSWAKPSGTQLVQLVDLSLGGCFIRTVSQPAVGTAINLEVRLPSGTWLSLEGAVANCVPGEGFGMQFTTRLTRDMLILLDPRQKALTDQGDSLST